MVKPGELRFAQGLASLALVAGAVVGAAASGSIGAILGSIAGAVLGFLVLRIFARGQDRRRRAVHGPFPESWREILRDRYDHYDRLPADWRARFEDDLRLFLREKRISGVGVAATEELRLLVAASAVTLSLGWPDYDWDHLTEVLLYPQDFDRDFGFEEEELAGEAHPWGTVILSVPALLESFDDPDDGYHVGIHEFAHILDVEQAHFDGIPVGLDAGRHAEWAALVEKERQRIRKGKSALDEYGEENPVEFLAVAVEAFFEAPLVLRSRHREVYEILRDTFLQDPAAWDDARGLTL